MKRIVSIVILFFTIFTLTSCTSNSTSSHPPITVNYPKDNSVNGYRISYTEDFVPDRISADEISSSHFSENSSEKNETVSVKYCANINSKVFHLTSCSSVKNMKEENKYVSSDRQHMLDSGYDPCKRCNP